MAVHLLGQGQAEGHQHGGPDHRVEADDLLAHKVDVGRPEFLIIGIVFRAVAHGGDVVGEGVEPDVYHVLGVKIHRDTPSEAGAGDAQVVQAVFDEVDHLILAAFRLDEVGLVLVKLQEAVGVI